MKLPENYKPLQTVQETKRFWLLFVPSVIAALAFGVTATTIFGVTSTITYLNQEKASPVVAIILAALSLILFTTAVTVGTIDYNKPIKFQKEYDADNAAWINSEFLPWVQNIVGFDVDYNWAKNFLINMEDSSGMIHKDNKFITFFFLTKNDETKELSIKTETHDHEEWEEDLLTKIADTSGAYFSGANA